MPVNAWTGEVHEGDALDVLEELPAESVHAVVTDPPYGLAFMGRSWDDFEPREYQQWCEEWARTAKRALTPGGHLMAFSGNRTHHRLFCGVEDAGFEVRDTLTWHYGSGFPKALDVSKALDKQAGAEREIVGHYEWPDGGERDWQNHDMSQDTYGEADGPDTRRAVEEPATSEADRWDGWKTCLKPATEFVVLARKPLSEGTVAENVLEHGTGALNIDGCRVDHDGDDLDGGATSGSVEFTNDGWNRDWMDDEEAVERYKERSAEAVKKGEELGRYPSNLVLDADAAVRMDDEVGELETGELDFNKHQDQGIQENCYGEFPNADERTGHYPADSGGPSRYFYTSKATRAERTEGGAIDNPHPTVKPQDLMEWLVKLVTHEDQIVLDPFAGSGTTLKAAKALGREFIGIEQQARWCDVARIRCGLTPADPSNVRADDSQQGLEAYTDGGDPQR